MPSLLNVNSFGPKLEAELSAALGPQVNVGDLSHSVFSGTSVDNISIVDDAAFSKGPNGAWNFSSIGKDPATEGRQPPEQKSADESGGSLSVGFSSTAQFPFTLTADLPGGGDLSLRQIWTHDGRRHWHDSV